MLTVEMWAQSRGSSCGKRLLVQSHRVLERPHREGPETWLLVPTFHLLCDLEQVTFLLWACFSTDKVRLSARSLPLGDGIMRDIFFFFMTVFPFQICFDMCR